MSGCWRLNAERGLEEIGCVGVAWLCFGLRARVIHEKWPDLVGNGRTSVFWTINFYLGSLGNFMKGFQLVFQVPFFTPLFQ